MMDKNNNLIPNPKVLLSKIKSNLPPQDQASEEVKSKADANFFSTESQMQAAAEAQSLQEKDLEDVARANDHRRKERVKDEFWGIGVWIIRVFLIGTVIGTIVVFWHWLAPLKWHFLTDAQLDRLITIAVSIIASSAFNELYKKIS